MSGYRYTLTRFAGHVPLSKRPYYRRGVSAYAAKLLIDRWILIPTLTNDPELRVVLRKRNYELGDDFFTVLRSPDDYVLTESAQAVASCFENRSEAFALEQEKMERVEFHRRSVTVRVLQRVFAALPEEGKRGNKPGVLERWARRKSNIILGQDD